MFFADTPRFGAAEMYRRLRMVSHLQYASDVMVDFESWWGPFTGHCVRNRDHGALAPCKTKAPDTPRWPMATKVAKAHRDLGILGVAGDTTLGKSFNKNLFLEAP